MVKVSLVTFAIDCRVVHQVNLLYRKSRFCFLFRSASALYEASNLPPHVELLHYGPEHLENGTSNLTLSHEFGCDRGAGEQVSGASERVSGQYLHPDYGLI